MDFGFTITLAALVAVVTGVTQAAKKAGLPSKYAPLCSLVFGVITLLGVTLFEVTVSNVIIGLAVGLMASGLYSGSKALASK